MNSESFLKLADLSSCRKQLFEEIKKSPQDLNLRIFLFQLCCVLTDWSRALSQLEFISQMDDTTQSLDATYRQLIHCEQKREQVFCGSELLVCFGPVTAWLENFKQVFPLLTSLKLEQAAALSSAGMQLAQTLKGKINGEPFECLFDGDSRFGPVLEVMLQGGYAWLPLENVEKLEFEPIEDLRDLVWRAVNITLKNKGTLLAFVPMRYPITEHTTDAEKLCRHTTWSEPEQGFYIGQGQRIWITDQAEYLFSDIDLVEFEIV